MTIECLEIEDVKVIHQFHASDDRGSFIKTFHNTDFEKLGIAFSLKESFYSTSKKNVIRGMHFHAPPYDHAKIVFCTQGAILDVALDLRKNSPTYGSFASKELSSDNHCALYIPRGFAHGFLSLTDDATTFYFVDGEYNKDADDGILYNSFGFPWNTEVNNISVRDLNFNTLQNFNTPFI